MFVPDRVLRIIVFPHGVPPSTSYPRSPDPDLTTATATPFAALDSHFPPTEPPSPIPHPPSRIPHPHAPASEHSTFLALLSILPRLPLYLLEALCGKTLLPRPIHSASKNVFWNRCSCAEPEDGTDCICDIQEKFRPVIYEFSKIITTASKLLRAAKPLNIPIYITTQNRARLGTTVSELGPYIDPATNPNVRADLDKTLFSMVTPELKAQFPAQPLDAIIVGIESHICVTQTTLDLLALGHRVYVVADGVSSVNPEERVVALARLRDAGAIVTTSESLLFEIMGDAKHAVFKQVSGLVKETGDETKKALGVFCGSKI
ncbi:isochorismatase domain-containing protein [Histoplasma capsulatum H143]|uniref:Isochorismatase domain-containing protein n=1 Tax=Ajellomyces capsulatus (strain H143) TaxID=544712 RepID=C6H4D8_AJECH|nr:isochorismatase domain-containing protein [Histoplasma capsulatum H143]